MPKRTTDFRDDLLADLADPREASSYLNAALEDSEEMFLVALRDVAEARQMAKVAELAGVARESVYRMLTVEGNPTCSSLLGILRAVGLRMAIQPEETPRRPRPRPDVVSKGQFGAGAAARLKARPLPTAVIGSRRPMAKERS
jgi:probable addiction module antidote protein